MSIVVLEVDVYTNLAVPLPLQGRIKDMETAIIRLVSLVHSSVGVSQQKDKECFILNSK